MKQIWIDYCKEFRISLDNFVTIFTSGYRFKSGKLVGLFVYIEWLEDQNKMLKDLLETDVEELTQD